MAAFATPAELASFLQVPEVDTATATLVLDVASEDIRSACGWNISQETVTAEEFDGTGCESIWIPTMNLTSVASVTAAGVAIPPTGYRVYRYGRLRRLNAYWPADNWTVVITYTHGYAVVPDDVKGACLVLAGSKYQNPGAGLTSYTDTVGGVSHSRTYAASSAPVPPVDDSEAVIARYKLAGVA